MVVKARVLLQLGKAGRAVARQSGQSRGDLRGNSEEWAAFEGWVRFDNGSCV